ncbi:MAG: hypothetical protein ACYC5H_16845 [Methylovirgula sp.]
MLVDVTNQKELRAWLRTQPRQISVVLAARAALRMLPMLWATDVSPYDRRVGGEIILPVFRASALAWAAANYPTCDGTLKDFANATFAAASAAADASDVAVGHAVFVTTAAKAAAYASAGADADASAAAVAKASANASSTTAAGIDFAIAVDIDLRALESGLSAGILASQNLWLEGLPRRIADLRNSMKQSLLARHEDWDVWINWYDARLVGMPSIEALERARVTLPNKTWQQGPKVVNAEIKRLIGEHTEKEIFASAFEPKQFEAFPGVLADGSINFGEPYAAPLGEPIQTSRLNFADLAEVASPAPFIAADGRLDAGPNIVFDQPSVDDELLTLPIRQRAVIDTIVIGLPTNAPPHLKKALNCYSDELEVRGVQPILGILNQMESIIEAERLSSDAQDWLAPGLKVAFQHFRTNHQLFARHFPLDSKRNETYAKVDVDESKAIGSALRDPFKEVASVAPAAHSAGVTTEDFVKIVDSLKDFAEVVSSRPVSATNGNYREPQSSSQLVLPHVGADDRILSPQPSETKRLVLMGLGFFERAYNLLGTTVTLLSTPYGALLLAKLGDAINALSKFVHLLNGV